MKNQILIAVDLSESSELVIKKGIELAIKMEASVILSSVVPMYVDYLQSQMSMVPTPWDEIYTAQKEAAIEELKLVQDKFPNIPIEIYVEVGNAKDVVIEKAKTEEAVKQIGIEWCIAQCKELRAHKVPVLHFYTMGYPDTTKQIASLVY